MAEVKKTELETWRSSLVDVAGVCEKLAPICGSVEELVGMLKLALENEAQLKLVMKEVLRK